MKILLASMSIEEGCRFSNQPNNAYPLGLAYIYSVLEAQNHTVELLWMNNYRHEIAENKLFEILTTSNPLIIGFQIFSMNRVSTFKVIEKIIRDYPHIQIIAGGIHTSIMYEQILKKYPQLISVIGEGEQTIKDLINALEFGSPLDKINGIAYVKGGEIIKTAPRSLIDNLDELPFPKHEIFFKNESNRTEAHLITSRGCPFNCSFCCLKNISNRVWRKRNIENVVDEIIALKKQYPRLNKIQFHDDTFMMDNERVIQFCKLIIEKNLGIIYECSARVKPVSKEVLEWMEKAGFKKIMFGLETGSEKMLHSIMKNITKKDVINLFNLLKDYNFTITTFLMCGFPGENEETIRETIEFVQKIQKIKYSWIAGVGKLWVYPGTEIYNKMKKCKYIDDDYWLSDSPTPYYIVEHSLRKLIEYENKIMDSVSIERIFTLRGFIRHFMKMPLQIIGFLKRNPDHLIRLIYNGKTVSIPFKLLIKILKQAKRILMNWRL